MHAHPDDESISTGGVIARYAAEGAHVTLVTCTRGEEGEIVVPDLKHLGTGRKLAEVREEELSEAVRLLGVTEHRFLGPYEDSGMVGTPENDRPTAFWNADLDEAAGRLAAVVRQLEPQVVVTYDEHGGYGHPDHIQAHRVTTLACAEAAPGAKRYHVVWGEAGTAPAAATTAVDVSAYLDTKLAAMAAHRTQLRVDGRSFALADEAVHEVSGTEWFTLAHGALGPVDPATGLETDLFAGVDS